MKYFDAHTHVQFEAFKDDVGEVIKRTAEAEVGMNVVGTQYDTSAAAVVLAEQHEGVWATVGLHPIHTNKSFHDTKELGPSFAKATEGKEGFMSKGETFDKAKYAELARSNKVIAIGECGLDYYRLDEATKQMQVENFIAQIELANELQKPLMLHIRNAYQDAIEVLKAHAKVKGNVHFFAGDWEIARQFLDLGFTLSFTGVITFTHDYDEVIKNTPLDMLLSETDAPYVTPVPHRGKRNEPSFVIEVIKNMAQIKGISENEVQAQLLQNARHVFQL